MPQVAGTGTIWSLPNYTGELFTADETKTPFLSMIGGLTGGRQTENYEFTTGQLEDYPAPKQPAISETASLIAPTASHMSRDYTKNITQIFQESVDISYVKQSNRGRLSGINSANQTANPADEMAYQIDRKLKSIARDVEHTFLQGSYKLATSENDANKTRGMLELCSAGTTINAAGAALGKKILDTLYREMADNGAYFDTMVLFCNSYQKQVLSNIYHELNGVRLPETRSIGGYNYVKIETDFFEFSIVFNRFMPADTLLLADVAHCAPVFQPVPGNGNFFFEPLSKVGASDRGQLYGQIGLDHGPAFLHASITNLEVK